MDTITLPGTDGIELAATVSGTGSPVALLHGFPQTRAMWRDVATRLAEHHTVVALDLRGYGESDKPLATGEDTYSKRTMAADVVAAMRALGHQRFALVGHDRGALVAFRTGLDHPDVVTHLGILDVLPTLDMWDVLHGLDAQVAFHLYLMAQPPALAEAMVAGAGEAFFGHFLDAWGVAPFAPGLRAAYVAASVAAVPSIVADYRASASVDVAHDTASRAAGERLAMPVTVLQQDWGDRLGFDAVALWRAWAPDLEHRATRSGHFMAEAAPEEVAGMVTDLLER
jgi:haloacetate dehalogenase